MNFGITMQRLTTFFIYISLMCYGCNSNATSDALSEDTLSEKRIPFTITSQGNIVCDVNINDSIPAKFGFDTGADALIIDSTFWHTYFPNKQGTPAGVFFAPFAFQTFRVRQHTEPLFFNSEASNFIFNQFYTADLKYVFYGEPTKGFFNIHSDDTVHIWEINFENNYIQIHNEFSFKSNEKITIPLKRAVNENGHQQFFINLPLKIICGNDTLISNTEYQLDTGSPYDIFYHRKDQGEVQFLEVYAQNTPILYGTTLTGRIRRNIVKCVVFDNYTVDSFRIYNSELNLITDSKHDKDSAKTVGINFLKRFNLFLDLKKNLITFVPIKKEHKMIEKFKYETNSNVVFAIAPNLPEESNLFFYKFLEPETGDINIFKEMGIKQRDILVSINRIKINSDIENPYFIISEIIENSDTIELVVKRKDKLMTLYYNKTKK